MAVTHRELAARLREAIAEGRYRPGDTLPRLEAIADEHGVAYQTVRAAIRLLRSEGLVESVRRRGTVVLDRERRRVNRGNLVTRDPARGYVMPAASRSNEPWQVHGQPHRDVLPIPTRPAELLDVEPGTEVLRRRRVTSPKDEAPFQLVDTWIPGDVVADAPRVAEAETGPGGYLDRLEDAGHGPLSWTEHLRVRMPTPEEAREVRISTAMPVMEIARVGTSATTTTPVEVTICVIPADRIEVITPLRRARSARWPREEPP